MEKLIVEDRLSQVGNLIYRWLNHCVSDEESLRQDYIIKGEKTSLFADYFLEQGCAELGIADRTAVEIKKNILFNTIHRLKAVTDSLEKADIKLILIYVNSSVPVEFIRKFYSERFQIYSVNEIFEKWQIDDSKICLEHDDWKKDREGILKKAKTIFNEGNNFLFLGAGVSIDAGLPNWDNLLKGIISAKTKKKKTILSKDFSLIKAECFESSIILARYINMALNIKDEELGQIIHGLLYKDVKESVLIKTISEVAKTGKIKGIITYNYDDLVETTLLKDNIPNISVFGKNRPSGNELPVIHVHGVVPQDNNSGNYPTPVLSEDEYHKLYKEAYHWSNIEQLHSLDRTNCFFIGLSMSDPNLRRLLEISHDGGEQETNHFVLLQRKSLGKKPDEIRNENFYYNMEIMMKGLGLNIIWFEDFNEIPKLLKKITDEQRID